MSHSPKDIQKINGMLYLFYIVVNSCFLIYQTFKLTPKNKINGNDDQSKSNSVIDVYRFF